MVLRKLFSLRTLFFFVFVTGILVYMLNVILVPSLFTNTQKKRTRNNEQEEYVDKHGVKVIVGHYKGELGSNVKFSQQELNKNRYLPVEGAGENGSPVYMKSHQQILSKRLWGLNQFNLVASDSISVDRKLKDVRSEDCISVSYDEDKLPATSVIIVFHNEAWSTLIRTVHSVINNSPKHLVKEIILVDDASDRSYLGDDLKDHLDSLSIPSFVIRSKERNGLIKSRLIGAKAAKAEVLTFLDAHCECTPGWLQPLLQTIRNSPTTVVCPIIDILDDTTFQYTKSFSLHWGAFNWSLHFRWFTLANRLLSQRRKNITSPYATPVMAGGLFSISTKYFWEIGSYDEDMDIWGGENLEMSFRVWQCGGRVEISPCSRVGHVFRKASPYSFPREGGVNTVLYGNLARVALVWMDQYSKFYFKIDQKAAEAAKNQNVTSRRILRDKLKCKSFDWYLDNVWPESFIPRPGQVFGKLKSKAVVDNCLNTPRPTPGSRGGTVQPGPAALYPCHPDFIPAQHFTHHKNGYLMSDESMCLDSPNWEHDILPGLRFSSCQELDRQLWNLEQVNTTSFLGAINFKTNQYRIIHRLSGKCVTVATGGTSDSLVLNKCTDHTDYSYWYLDQFSW